MDKNRFWDLLAKVKSGEATPEEQLELNQHIAVNPQELDLVKQLDAFWEIPVQVKSAPAADELRISWNKVRYKISNQKAITQPPLKTGKLRRIVKYAIAMAGLLIVAVSGIWIWNSTKSTTPLQKNIVSTKNGSKSKIELPDGTQVWLNVGSRVNYDENYGKEKRELTLTGEAYFDVAHDEKMPFILHTGKMEIKVLGTAFNVKAYPGDGFTEASLIRGSIEVTFPDRPLEKLILKPSDKISILNKEPDSVKAAVKVLHTVHTDRPAIMVSSIQYTPVDSAIIETAWVNNRLIFRSKTFEELSRDIERWFNVTIEVGDTAILSKQFTGTFSNESITDALDALSLSYPFHYKLNRNTNTVTITE
jgi:transmembrane sensor